jgi:hypothetical protein
VAGWKDRRRLPARVCGRAPPARGGHQNNGRVSGTGSRTAGGAAMQRQLADNRADKHGGHRYVPEDFGVDSAALRNGPKPYREAFGVD